MKTYKNLVIEDGQTKKVTPAIAHALRQMRQGEPVRWTRTHVSRENHSYGRHGSSTTVTFGGEYTYGISYQTYNKLGTLKDLVVYGPEGLALTDLGRRAYIDSHGTVTHMSGFYAVDAKYSQAEEAARKARWDRMRWPTYHLCAPGEPWECYVVARDRTEYEACMRGSYGELKGAPGLQLPAPDSTYLKDKTWVEASTLTASA